MTEVKEKPAPAEAATGKEKIEKAKKAKIIDFKLDIEEMTKAGLQFGHKNSNCHPKMKPYLEGTRNSINIIDLAKTKEKFEEALKFIQKIVSENKTLLLVGTKIQAKKMIEEMAKECVLPYVSERWLGGTFTNFETILKRINYFKELERKLKEGELEKYTKKERAIFNKELEKLRDKFGGIRELTKIPDAIFVLGMKEDGLAIKEAKIRRIKVVAVADTNTDPSLVEFPIPANDDATSSIRYILERVKEAIESAKSKVPPAERAGKSEE